VCARGANDADGEQPSLRPRGPELAHAKALVRIVGVQRAARPSRKRRDLQQPILCSERVWSVYRRPDEREAASGETPKNSERRVDTRRRPCYRTSVLVQHYVSTVPPAGDNLNDTAQQLPQPLAGPRAAPPGLPGEPQCQPDFPGLGPEVLIMAQYGHYPNPAPAQEQRLPVLPATLNANPIFQGWGPKF
jgi:hypothetical protein